MTPEYIIIHHSLTQDGATVSWGAIRNYHTKTLGWSNIGYHFGIEKTDTEIALYRGRALNVAGAHCKEGGMNLKSIGVCIVGDYDLIEPEKEKWDYALDLTRMLMSHFKIPFQNVLGHGEAQIMAGYDSPKTCPGKKFGMGKFRSSLDVK